MAIIAALPFVIVMIVMCVSLFMDLRRDPLIVATRHRAEGIDDEVRVHANTLAATDLSTDVLPSGSVDVDASLLEQAPKTDET